MRGIRLLGLPGVEITVTSPAPTSRPSDDVLVLEAIRSYINDAPEPDRQDGHYTWTGQAVLRRVVASGFEVYRVPVSRPPVVALRPSAATPTPTSEVIVTGWTTLPWVQLRIENASAAPIVIDEVHAGYRRITNFTKARLAPGQRFDFSLALEEVPPVGGEIPIHVMFSGRV